LILRDNVRDCEDTPSAIAKQLADYSRSQCRRLNRADGTVGVVDQVRVIESLGAIFDSDRPYFDHQVRMRQSPYLDRGAGRERMARIS